MLVTLFSEYLKDVPMPLPYVSYSREEVSGPCLDT